MFETINVFGCSATWMTDCFKNTKMNQQTLLGEFC